jgi:protein O-mannosyl-transferase
VPLTEVRSQTPPTISREKLALAGTLALVFLTFASTFTFGWVYDDPPQIPGNPDLRWDRLGFLFTHHLWASIPGITNARFYRPFLSLWFLINKTVFGLNPPWFHVTSVLAHLLATALAFFIARSVLKGTGAALLAAAIFGLHPLQAESTSWISAVNDPLAAIFCFGSFLAYRKARAASKYEMSWWFVAAVCFLCAMFTKEVAVLLPVVVLTDIWCDREPGEVQKSRASVASFAVGLYGSLGVVLLLFRHIVLGHTAAAPYPASWGSALLTAPKILLFQLWHVLLPAGLSPHYDFAALGSGDLANALFLFCAVLMLFVAAVLAARKAPTLWATYAWLIFPLLPSLNLHWLNEDDFVHDRYMYMSMLGVGLIVGTGFVALKRRWPEQRLIPGLAFALVIALAFASAVQSQIWANDVALFARGVQIAPRNEWAQLNYGSALSARNKFSEAAPHFVKSYDLKPGWRAADGAGFAFFNAGDTQQAEYWYTLVLQQNASLADAWFALGQIRLAQRRPAEAVALFQKAIALSPNAEGYHYALGLALEQSGNTAAAMEAYRIELQLYPSQTAARRAVERLAASH